MKFKAKLKHTLGASHKFPLREKRAALLEQLVNDHLCTMTKVVLFDTDGDKWVYTVVEDD